MKVKLCGKIIKEDHISVQWEVAGVFWG